MKNINVFLIALLCAASQLSFGMMNPFSSRPTVKVGGKLYWPYLTVLDANDRRSAGTFVLANGLPVFTDPNPIRLGATAGAQATHSALLDSQGNPFPEYSGNFNIPVGDSLAIGAGAPQLVYFARKFGPTLFKPLGVLAEQALASEGDPNGAATAIGFKVRRGEVGLDLFPVDRQGPILQYVSDPGHENMTTIENIGLTVASVSAERQAMIKKAIIGTGVLGFLAYFWYKYFGSKSTE